MCPWAAVRSVNGDVTGAQSWDRAWLAAILRADPELPPAPAGFLPEQALAAAVRERVVALVSTRLAVRPPGASTPSAEVLSLFSSTSRSLMAQSMFRDWECRQIIHCLGKSSLSSLVLKGAALAHTLYDEPHLRQTGDIDLLLGMRSDVESAAAALAGIGYSSDIEAVPGNLVGFELLCLKDIKQGFGWEVDLHWRLSNTPLFADAFCWKELLEESKPLSALGPGARSLGAVHAFFHACLHRATNLQFGDGDQLGWLYDIHLLARGLDESAWHRVLSLASARGLAGVCLHALQAARREFGNAGDEWLLDRLDATARREWLRPERMHSWLYTQWATFRSLPTAHSRMRWVRQRLFPSGRHLRKMHGRREEGLAWITVRRFRSALDRITRPR